MNDVLIVDDSPADRAIFRTLLNRAGFSVHEAARRAARRWRRSTSSGRTS